MRLGRTSYELNNTTEPKEEKDITNILETVSETVVGISKIKNTGDTIFLSNGATSMGLGTGVIINEKGYILTNSHVSGEKKSSCYVTLKDGRNYNGTVIWSDSDIDISVVKISVDSLKATELGDSDNVKLGEKVYAIGNPVGFEFQRTVTSGIISAIDRSIKIEEENKVSYMEDLIQTDATINPGSSGGPLINENGEFIGINTVKITSAEGIGFAIPINTIKPIIEKIINNNTTDTASLGIFAYDKNVLPYLDTALKLENGIYIADVKNNSAAYNAGLQKGDIILNADGQELNKMSQLREYIYSKNPGDTIKISLKRGNIPLNYDIVLGKK